MLLLYIFINDYYPMPRWFHDLTWNDICRDSMTHIPGFDALESTIPGLMPCQVKKNAKNLAVKFAVTTLEYYV